MSTGPTWLRWRRLAFLFSFSNVLALLLILASLAVLSFVFTTARFLPVAGDNMYPEAAGVVAAQRWAHGLPLYEDYRQPPYLVTAFPPLWYAFLAGAAKFGLNNLDSLTLFGRMLSLASLLGIAGLAYLWNRRLGFSPPLALLSPALYLSFPILIPWAVTARPDFPSLFLGLLAIYWAGLKPSTGSICLAGTAASLAFLIRHNSVAVPITIVLWLLWSSNRRLALVFSLVWGVVVGFTLGLFEFSSHGLLLLNLSGAKFGPLAVTYVRDSLFRILISPGNGFAVALFIFGCFGFLQSWYQKQEHTRLLRIYLVVSLGFALLGTAAAGAAVNHYLEPALVLALLVPPGLARLEQAWEPESPLSSLVVTMILILLLPSLDVQRWNAVHTKPENFRRVATLTENKRVFADIPYLEARLPAPQLLDLVSLTNTERVGQWSSAALVQALRDKKYELVILHEAADVPYDPAALYPRYPRLDAAVRSAINENYRLCFELDASFVYGPISSDKNPPGNSCLSLAVPPAQIHARSAPF